MENGNSVEFPSGFPAHDASVAAIIKRRRRVITPIMCVTINNRRLAFLFRANRIHTGLMHMLIACLHTYHELARSHAQLWPCPAPEGMALLVSVRLEGPEHNRRMQRRTKAVQVI